MPKTIGYSRVSTDGQTLDAQNEALKAAGCEKVYSEKASGAKSDRAALAKAISSLEAGDVLVVTRLDRLARSVRDLMNTLHAIGERGAMFKSVADTWADTTTAHGRLMLTILGGLAEFERELTRSRCAAGIERARANGVKFGRPSVLTPFQRTEALRRRDAGERHDDIAALFDVSRSVISRLHPARLRAGS